MLFISIALLFQCLQTRQNKWITNLGFFVLFSKLLDFYSDADTVTEEIGTLILSIAATSVWKERADFMTK